MKHISAAFAAILILSGSPVLAQEYVESFDGPVVPVMLNGAVEIGTSGVWETSIAEGSLQLVNTTADNAVRYIAIENVVYPGAQQPSSTNEATIETSVLVTGSEKAGAGLMGRFEPRSKNYLLFTVGTAGSAYFVLKREPGGAKRLAAGTNPAIHSGQVNKLKLSNRQGTLVFEVNGTEIIRVPSPTTGEIVPRHVQREQMPTDLVGIGAFGKGTTLFEEVRISGSGASQPKIEQDPIVRGGGDLENSQDQLKPAGQ